MNEKALWDKKLQVKPCFFYVWPLFFVFFPVFSVQPQAAWALVWSVLPNKMERSCPTVREREREKGVGWEAVEKHRAILEVHEICEEEMRNLTKREIYKHLLNCLIHYVHLTCLVQSQKISILKLSVHIHHQCTYAQTSTGYIIWNGFCFCYILQLCVTVFKLLNRYWSVNCIQILCSLNLIKIQKIPLRWHHLNRHSLVILVAYLSRHSHQSCFTVRNVLTNSACSVSEHFGSFQTATWLIKEETDMQPVD